MLIHSPRTPPPSFGQREVHVPMCYSRKCGWLKVFEGKKSKERWCVLDERLLHCFKSPSAKKLKGSLTMTVDTMLGCQRGERAKIFQVKLPGNLVSQFEARDPREMVLWAAALKHNLNVWRAIEQNRLRMAVVSAPLDPAAAATEDPPVAIARPAAGSNAAEPPFAEAVAVEIDEAGPEQNSDNPYALAVPTAPSAPIQPLEYSQPAVPPPAPAAEQEEKEEEQQLNVEDALYCPITLELMTDPVIAADGHTYERSAIEDWFQNCGAAPSSPKTNASLPHKGLIPNHALRSLILARQEEGGSQ